MKQALIIFTKNPIAGQVKTRLAATVGNDTALSVYLSLLHHTRSITKDLPLHRYVFYADQVNQNDLWDNDCYTKLLQEGKDLGERMAHAFQKVFDKGYEAVVIIGTDCFELRDDDVKAAFDALATQEVVIGPARDGGYYLLGMRQLYPILFENKAWSEASVCTATKQDLHTLQISYQELALKSDIDTETDLINYLNTKTTH